MLTLPILASRLFTLREIQAIGHRPIAIRQAQMTLMISLVDEAFRRPYARRRFIWEEVIAASANLRLSGEDVAKRMDRWRSSQTPTFSLQKLNDSLKTAIQLWGEKHIELLKFI